MSSEPTQAELQVLADCYAHQQDGGAPWTWTEHHATDGIPGYWWLKSGDQRLCAWDGISLGLPRSGMPREAFDLTIANVREVVAKQGINWWRDMYGADPVAALAKLP